MNISQQESKAPFFIRVRRKLASYIAPQVATSPVIVEENTSPFLSQNTQYSEYDIGEYSYGKPQIYSWDEQTKLVIGRFCSIADGVVILLGGEHRTEWVTTYPFSVLFKDANSFVGHPKTKGNIKICNDVWLGTDSLILSGVTIGDGAVIAARSVVTKDVAPYSIVAGNPAQLIRMRFSENQIRDLLNIAWWNWPMEKIESAWPLLLSPNIDAFIEQYK